MKFNVDFLDLKAAYIELKDELDEAYKRVMSSGWYIFGQELEKFEEEFARYCNSKYCIGVGNGLEALQLILKGYGIGPGDEVIVPANTYIATWLAVSYVGAIPVPVEPDALTYNIDSKLISKSITKKTKAIIAVHLYGLPAQMQKINDIAEKFGLKVIEDAAQSHGAIFMNNKTGNLGEAAAFSFYPGKNLGAFGDGGAVVCKSEDLYEKIRMLRNYGSKQKYYNEVKGHNSRLDPLQASFLSVKLKYLDEWNSRRNFVANFYLENLKHIPNIVLPQKTSNSVHAWHLFVIRHPKRDELKSFLQEKGVQTLIHYPIPPHLSNAYSDLNYEEGSFPITEEIAKSVLSLPISPHLTFDQANYVVEKIQEYCKFN